MLIKTALSVPPLVSAKLIVVFPEVLLQNTRAHSIISLGSEGEFITMAADTSKCSKMDQRDQHHLHIVESEKGAATFDLLPNEVAEIPIKMAMSNGTTQERYDFLVDVMPNISSRFKGLAAVKSMWKGFSHFEMLPTEVAIIPIKMALSDLNIEEKSDFLVDVVSKVSTRFKTLATHKDLWQGRVKVTGDHEKIKKVIHEFLSDGIDHISMRLNDMDEPISSEDVLTIALRCPKLKTLGLTVSTLSTWPTFISPWTSLISLILVGVRPNIFAGVELHHNFPNLRHFVMGQLPIDSDAQSVVLPDMDKCNFLKTVHLGTGQFIITGLPRQLRQLICLSSFEAGTTIIGMDKASLQARFEKCDIDARIKFLLPALV